MQSGHRLERKAGRNVEVMWLLGRLVPDHKAIANFRKDNGPALRKVCARFGVDGVTWRAYEEGLDPSILDLHSRLS